MADPQGLSSAWKPGDRKPDLHSMLRVDHAGEYGATRIYAGQLAMLRGSSRAAHLVTHMAAQEERHLARFNQLLAERKVRPTLLQPLWHVGGFALGAATALIGPRAAMACTAAVETEIDKHYADQLRSLGSSEPDLAATITDFQREELEHRDTALQAGAENTFGYPILSGLIRAGCRLAIEISKRI